MNVDKLQYFAAEDYAAFDAPKPDNDGPQERKERLAVSDKLRWLHDQLWSFIHKDHIHWDLHKHHQELHHVSSFQFSYIKSIPSMWTHFGKSHPQLQAYRNLIPDRKDKETNFFDAFYVHTRIQFYINDSKFRSWLILTDKDSYDRRIFKEKVISENDKSWCQMYWLRLSDIFDNGYFYEIDGERLPLTTSLTWDQFKDFIRKERKDVYSGIVKEYDPNDKSISHINIIKELQQTLLDLYPLYNLTATRLSSRLSPAAKRGDLTGLFGGNVRVSKSKVRTT